MRWSLLTVRLVILVVSLISAAILVLTILPLATGGLKIDVPQNDVQWSMDGDVLHAEVPVNIYNGGYFDIEDFALTIDLTDMDGTHLSNTSSVPTDLASGTWTEIVLPVQFDIGTLPLDKRIDIVFNGTEVRVGIGLDSYFGLRTIHVTMDGSPDQTMSIPALVSNLNIDPGNLRLASSRGGYQLVQPYSFDASDLLTGKDVTVSAVIADPDGTLGSSEMTMTLQQQNQGQMYVPINNSVAAALLSRSDTLTVTASVGFDNITFTRTVRYDWTPPITNVALEGMSISAGQLLADYRFDATPMITGQIVQVAITVSDQTGTIGQGTDSFSVASVNHRSVAMNIAPATAARLIGTAEDWQVDLAITINGVTAHVIRTYHWTGGA